MRDLTDSERACIARATHEVNRAYCRAIGDSTQVPWDLFVATVQAMGRALLASSACRT